MLTAAHPAAEMLTVTCTSVLRMAAWGWSQPFSMLHVVMESQRYDVQN